MKYLGNFIQQNTLDETAIETRLQKITTGVRKNTYDKSLWSILIHTKLKHYSKEIKPERLCVAEFISSTRPRKIKQAKKREKTFRGNCLD